MEGKTDEREPTMLQIVAALLDMEADEVWEQLTTAIRVLNKDDHRWSKRPCATCQAITDSMAEPFGCIWEAKQMEMNDGT